MAKTNESKTTSDRGLPIQRKTNNHSRKLKPRAKTSQRGIQNQPSRYKLSTQAPIINQNQEFAPSYNTIHT